ncbi:MAG TPA: AAA family ATPase [Gaiellaceae bacterium]|nr:AAA family ATPase [Gaiellaceae bacterium]
MHLRAIKLRGFKSFPEPVEVRLEPGVAVVVGPNGSGKSNIADALIWAAGSLAPSELRAEKPDDVLFNGSASRPAADHCEVELLFDNEDGTLPEIDYSEVSIVRRLHRGGEGQYLVNGAHVRRTDVVELLSDVGLGSAMGSIVSQGRVEAILASKPEERRTLVEEAAGLGRFKRRRHRAELKLARVAAQVERARDVEAEVAKRLRPLALQATAAERAEKLGVEIAALRAGVATLDLRTLDARIAEAMRRRGAHIEQRGAAERALEALLAERGRAEDALAEAAGGREGAASTLYRLRSASERLELRREAAESLLARVREAPAAPDAGLLEQARIAEARAAALERAIAEREGLPPAARALAEEGASLALSLVEVDEGSERAVAAAVGAALVASTPEEGLRLLEQARERGLGNLSVLIRPGHFEPLAGIEVVPRERLLSSAGPAVTVEGHYYDPARGVLTFTGDTAEAVLLELEAQRRRLLDEAAALRAQAARAVPRLADPALVAAAAALVESISGALRAAERLQAPMLAEADRGAVRAGELAAELRALGGREVELRREHSEAAERVAGVDVEVARFEAERAEARRRLDAAAGAEPADGDRDELAEKLERLERRREQLGGVNPFAKEEYAAEKERLSELRTQREDLDRALEELRALRDELTETVERRFAETFDAVQRNFAEVASTLFPGGHGRLRLTEPEEEGGEAGIEVELSPAGKRVTRLSLLSGGEKALGAISFLFALFLARPCPFYLLDEVEAALDDTNIGRFCALLRRFADRAQFIVVTHQKRTMEAADALYGVTMGGDGVSQIVSRRLPREDAAAVSAA